MPAERIYVSWACSREVPLQPMAAPQAVVQAVQAAIVASAHLAAYEHVSAAALACRRLGGLTSGRWRSVARDLDGLEDELQTAFASAADAVSDRATNLGVHEDTLWTAGDAAATLDVLRESALDEVEEDSAAARLLHGNVLFGPRLSRIPICPTAVPHCCSAGPSRCPRRPGHGRPTGWSAMARRRTMAPMSSTCSSPASWKASSHC